MALAGSNNWILSKFNGNFNIKISAIRLFAYLFSEIIVEMKGFARKEEGGAKA